MTGAWDPEAIIFAKVRDKIAEKNLLKEVEEESEVDGGGGLESDGIRKKNRDELKKKEPQFFPEAEINDETIEQSLDADGNIPSTTIHTVCIKSQDQPDSSPFVPIVMLHGLGGSSVEFHKNYSELSAKGRIVYGIDMPGFGLSSRDTNYCCAKYSAEEVQKCEDKLVNLLEAWREKKDIDEMVIVGHSFGGYVAMAYAAKHRNRVCQLVLIEPWGILNKEQSQDLRKKNPNYKHNPLYIRLAMTISKGLKLKPLSLLRTIGYGIGFLVFGLMVTSSHEKAYGDSANKYFIGLNTLYDPRGSGEDLFRVLSGNTYMYPVISFQTRLDKIVSYPPMTVIYGECHEIDNVKVSFVQEGKILKEKMSQRKLYDVDILEAPESGHHAHAENPKWFHDIMNKLLKQVDKSKVEEITAL